MSRSDLVEHIRAAEPDLDRIRDWAHALRTTKYSQRTDGQMGHPKEGCLCVLGLAAAELSDNFDRIIQSHWDKSFGALLGCKEYLSVEPIYMANDNEELTFEQFAEVLDHVAQA